jgi:hypothetical protein
MPLPAPVTTATFLSMFGLLTVVIHAADSRRPKWHLCWRWR